MGPDSRLEVGRRMHERAAELYPICRSITGDGVRETLARIASEVPLAIEEVPSGTPVLDWTVPKEWNIREAWIADVRGERLIDFARSNLHLVSYSIPVRRRVSLEELKQHVFTLPEHPDWIPYRTSYYNATWGFCLSQSQLDGLKPSGRAFPSIRSRRSRASCATTTCSRTRVSPQRAACAQAVSRPREPRGRGG
jgi:aminopeptidase-like protein